MRRAGAALRRALPLVLPMMLVAALLVGQQWQDERERTELLATQVSQRLADTLELELLRLDSALQVLAAAPALDAGDLQVLHRQARDALPALIANNVVVFDAEGRQRMNTLLPPEGPLPPGRATPDAGLRVFQSRGSELSDLFRGPVTGTWLLVLGVPVRRGESIPFGLGSGISPDRIGNTLERGGLPDGWIAAVLDSRGTIVARSREARRYVGQPAVDELRAAVAAQPQGLLETRTKDGIAVLTAYRRVGQRPWTVAVGAPRAVLEADQRRGALGWAAATLLAFVLAWGVAAWQLRREPG